MAAMQVAVQPQVGQWQEVVVGVAKARRPRLAAETLVGAA